MPKNMGINKHRISHIKPPNSMPSKLHYRSLYYKFYKYTKTHKLYKPMGLLFY